MSDVWDESYINAMINKLQTKIKKITSVFPLVNPLVTFDFSFLYTKIQTLKLIINFYKLYILVDVYFKGRSDTYATVTKYEAKWISDSSIYDISCSK